MTFEETKILKLIGAKLQYYRMEQSIKQQTVAQQLHVNKSTISRIENGHENVSLIFLLKYCLLVGINFTNLAAEIQPIIAGLPVVN